MAAYVQSHCLPTTYVGFTDIKKKLLGVPILSTKWT